MKNLSSWPFLTTKKMVSLLAILAMLFMYAACSEEQDPLSSVPDSDRRKTTMFDAPSVSCVEATQTSITVMVTAGASGAPAGFSLQWTTQETLDANNGVWPSDETMFCKAGFSGNASGHVFNLTEGGTATVSVGNILYDTPGASSECLDDLLCGTQYVFRAFAHATSTVNKSAWSINQACSTDVCLDDCVDGFGYWKNSGPVPTGGNEYTWPQAVKDNGLALGDKTYTPEELQSILQTAGATNGLIKLAHQLIAAKMNIANGAVGTSIESVIADADALIGSLIIPPVGSDSLTNGAVASLHDALSAFNDPQEGESYCPN